MFGVQLASVPNLAPDAEKFGDNSENILIISGSNFLDHGYLVCASPRSQSNAGVGETVARLYRCPLRISSITIAAKHRHRR